MYFINHDSAEVPTTVIIINDQVQKSETKYQYNF